MGDFLGVRFLGLRFFLNVDSLTPDGVELVVGCFLKRVGNSIGPCSDSTIGSGSCEFSLGSANPASAAPGDEKKDFMFN